MSDPAEDGTQSVRFLPVGEAALSVEFGQVIDADINRRVIALGRSLDSDPPEGMTEAVPTYRSLLISYDPAQVRGAALEREITSRLSDLGEDGGPGRLWQVPVVYGGEAGLDLESLAEEKGMTVDELIDLHSGAEYRIYMIGFAPGFAYLGGLPEALHTPRLPTPRQDIPAGAVGLGGQQGSINSVRGPSGWRFIGWTPWRAFDPARDAPFLFAAGDRVRFARVSPEEGIRIAEAISKGDLSPEPEATP